MDEEMEGLRQSQLKGIKDITRRELMLALDHVDWDAKKRLLVKPEDVRQLKVEVLDELLEKMRSFIFI